MFAVSADSACHRIEKNRRFYMNTQQTIPSLGIWGMRHEAFLRQYRHSTYVTLLTSGGLDDYLAGIDQCAAEMAEKLTERLKGSIRELTPTRR